MALLDGKKHFLSLLHKDNWRDIFLYLEEEIGRKPVRWINLNQFNRKELEKVETNKLLNNNVKELAEMLGRASFTFQELETLNKMRQLEREQMVDMLKVFSIMLSGMRSEPACIRFGQYLRNIPQNKSFKDDSEIREAAQNLMQKDLPAWRSCMFRFEATMQTTAICLPYAKHKILLEASNDCEACFIAENIRECTEYGFASVVESMIKTNPTIQRLKEILNLEEAFYVEYQEEIISFCLNGGADIAVTYFAGMEQEESQREKFKWIVKAALCGKLKKLRFRDNDLEAECGISLKEHLQEIWIADEELEWDGSWHLTCGEDSTFHGIMEMGIKPYPTCMSYIKGVYKECLMAYFDANKKVVYIKSNGKVLAKAVMRLTKMCVGGEIEEYPEFRDIEKETIKVREQPVIFLERMYTGIQGERQRELQKLMIKFAEYKAWKMDLPLVLAKEYKNVDGYHLETVGIYVTKSKAGRQYLDSFGGDRINGKNNRYYYEMFWIRMKESVIQEMDRGVGINDEFHK